MDRQAASSNSGQDTAMYKQEDQCSTAKRDMTENVENSAEQSGEQSGLFECPVCLQTASFPVQLPCSHIFCFLCVKGAAHRSKRCAMCRQEIPMDFFNDPKLLCAEEIKEKSKTIFDAGYQWFYEGRNGWWQYDERTSIELEKKYKSGEKLFELLIAGFLYIIDFESMRQYRRNDQHRRRRIRRDLRNIPGVKGIAGLKYSDSENIRPSGDGGEASQPGSSSSGDGSGGGSNPVPSNLVPTVVADTTTGLGDDAYLTPPAAPNNTPQTPMTPADSNPGSLSNSQEDLSMHLQTLHLNQNQPPSASLPRPDYAHFRYPDDEHVDYDMMMQRGQHGELECPYFGDHGHMEAGPDYEDEDDDEVDDRYFQGDDDVGTDVDQDASTEDRQFFTVGVGEGEPVHGGDNTSTQHRMPAGSGRSSGHTENTGGSDARLTNTGVTPNTGNSSQNEAHNGSTGHTRNVAGSSRVGNGESRVVPSNSNSTSNSRTGRAGQGNGTKRETFL